ncbi:MAG TPA: radical SAM/SPASM domain-containing protein [Chitinophagales bacterium]|nr:radical SAM/SPASM domain-containing protein [Chitinophagales bacterium]HQW78041.1 radical SAM/SPASM domain-containing protein [Chitinophagales bacterium]HRB66817.1 radical SAM/SPASM domain-containing protein [Chitinophagales bacterium]
MNTSIQNYLNLLSKLSISKVWNMMLVYISFYLTKYFKIPIQWGKPFSVSFEPTTSCNLRCPECPSGLRSFSRPIGMLEPSFFRKTIDELSKHLFYLTFYFQGEPYLNKNFLEMVTYAKQKKIYTSTSTNAHYFTDEVAKKTIESGLDRLIISIDGTTQETYQQYRVGGQLSKVIEGAKLIVKWKKELQSTTPFVIFQFLVVKPNEHQIDDLKLLAKDIGVDEVILKTAQVYDYENGNELIPENEQYSRYRKNSDGTYSIKNSLENSCWKLWHSCVITWDGKVVPCCFDKDAQHQLGDLKSNTFNQIWNNDKYKNFRVKLVKGRKEIDICTNCSEGCEVNFNYEV